MYRVMLKKRVVSGPMDNPKVEYVTITIFWGANMITHDLREACCEAPLCEGEKSWIEEYDEEGNIINPNAW